jgi:hypothetical protein
MWAFGTSAQSLAIAGRTLGELSLWTAKNVDYESNWASEHYQKHPENRTIHRAVLCIARYPDQKSYI